MAKQAPKSKPKVVSSKTSGAVGGPGLSGFIAKLPWWSTYLIIFLFAVLLYSNTLWNKYAVDDAMVLTNNHFAKKGLGGLHDIFTHDALEGFFGEKGATFVSGGRYRPLSSMTLATEYEITRKLGGDKRTEINEQNIIIGDKDPYLAPALSHFINILLFGLTCALLCLFLQQVIPEKFGLKSTGAAKSAFELGIPLMGALLFAAHPIHTEAVANIKGRDELMSMLFALLALIYAVKYVRTQKMLHVALGTLAFFIALMSKENAITFFAIIPLTFFFFTGAKTKDYIITLGLYFIPIIIFLGFRNHYTQTGITTESNEVLNNPFLLATATEHYATVIATFLDYIKLLIFPHPLSHDYYYNQIPYVDVKNISFLASLLINVSLVVYALLQWKKKTIPAYAILFYYITFSIASNIFFTVGAVMNERFIYMSSAGFCILLAYGLQQYIKNRATLAAVFITVLAIYSFKTYSRNFNWYNDYTLLTSDVRYSPNSAKLQRSLGVTLTTKASEETDPAERARLLSEAIPHIQTALKIYPDYFIAWIDLANAVYNLNHKSAEVIPIYERALQCKTFDSYEVYLGLASVYNLDNQLQKAKECLWKAVAKKPDETGGKLLLAEVTAKLNQPDSVDHWLGQSEKIKSVEASTYYKIAQAYIEVANNVPKTIEFLNKAIAADPKNEKYCETLGEVFEVTGNIQEAIHANEKAIQLNPNFAVAYQNLARLYQKAGNLNLAAQYTQKYNNLTAGGKK